MNQQEKPTIVYLLGAGASAGKASQMLNIDELVPKIGLPTKSSKSNGSQPSVLPVVSEFNERLAVSLAGLLNSVTGRSINDDVSLKAVWQDTYNSVRVRRGTTNIRSLAEFIDTVRESIKEQLGITLESLNREASIDTLARRYYLMKDATSKLNDLKALMSIFLIWEQYRFGVDKRYGLFWATILKGHTGNAKLPDHVKILSWNYDSQLEMSIREFFASASVADMKGKLQVLPYETSKKSGQEFDPTRFFVLKINGSVDTSLNRDRTIIDTHEYRATQIGQFRVRNIQGIQAEVANDLLFTMYNCMQGILTPELRKETISPLLTFAWEEESHIQTDLHRCLPSIKPAETLVIIGYSFPTFNRDMDRRILASMPKLKKLYVQTMPNSMGDVTSRLNALLPSEHTIKIVPIPNVDEFYVPYELN